MQIITKIKRRSGQVALALIALIIITHPMAFLTLGADLGAGMVQAIVGILLLMVAVSQIDRHWSYPNPNKPVSLSNFMAKHASEQTKGKIYVAVILAFAAIIAASILG